MTIKDVFVLLECIQKTPAHCYVLHKAHVQKLTGGKYIRPGLGEGIQRALDRCIVMKRDSVELQLHVDGKTVSRRCILGSSYNCPAVLW